MSLASRARTIGLRMAACRPGPSVVPDMTFQTRRALRWPLAFSRMPSLSPIRSAVPIRKYGAAASAKTIPVPGMGDSISEGRILTWFKQEGEAFNNDDVIVSLETDKITVEVRAPEAGLLNKQLAKQGDDVRVGQDLFTFTPGAGATASSPKKEAPAPKPAAEPPKAAPKAPSSPLPPAQKSPPAASETPKTAPSPPPAAVPPPVATVFSGTRSERRVKMTKMRERISKRLKESQDTAAMLTTFNEIDMFNIIALRNKHKEAFEKKHGVKLGFMSPFVKAAAAALKEIPIVNAVIDGTEIVHRDYIDISVAVASPTGLVVPVLRNVESMGFADIEKQIAAYGQKAKDGSLTIEEMTGGSFTISNGGTYGSMFGTPIINPPQSAILGMHSVKDRPYVVNGEIKIRPIMYVALTYDHRLIDGREAVLFLKKIKSVIEDPEVLLFDL